MRSHSEQFELATAAHHFLIQALPFRHPESRYALERLIRKIESLDIPVADVQSVLLQCVTAIDKRERRLPGLVERFLARSISAFDSASRFSICVTEAIIYSGVGNALVQRAIAIIRNEFKNPRFTQADVAGRLRTTPSALSDLFHAQTQFTFSQYVRSVRLEHAAVMLLSTDERLKTIWVTVGYNDRSTFCHDFRRMFAMSPSEYRARGLCHVAEATYCLQNDTHAAHDDGCPGNREWLLLVDDDEFSTDIIGRALRRNGYSVTIAATGCAALREALRVKPRSILLDYRLPDMTGIECLRQLRETDLGIQPTIALFTADAYIDDVMDDVKALNAFVASKLCSLEDIEMLVGFLSGSSRV